VRHVPHELLINPSVSSFSSPGFTLSCIGANVYPMLVMKFSTDVFNSYFTRKARFCVNKGW